MVLLQALFNDDSARRIHYPEIRRGSLDITAKNIPNFTNYVLREKNCHNFNHDPVESKVFWWQQVPNNHKHAVVSKIHKNTLLIQLIWGQIVDMAVLMGHLMPWVISLWWQKLFDTVCHQCQGMSCSFTQHSELGTCSILSLLSHELLKDTKTYSLLSIFLRGLRS